jgi:hypothetical protein
VEGTFLFGQQTEHLGLWCICTAATAAAAAAAAAWIASEASDVCLICMLISICPASSYLVTYCHVQYCCKHAKLVSGSMSCEAHRSAPGFEMWESKITTSLFGPDTCAPVDIQSIRSSGQWKFGDPVLAVCKPPGIHHLHPPPVRGGWFCVFRWKCHQYEQ